MASTPAPGDLELLRLFVNTYDVEDDVDKIGTPGALAGWLREHGLPAGRPTSEDVSRVQAVREALRRLMLANNGGPVDPGAVATLASAARAAPLLVSFDPQGAARLEPAASGVDAAIARLLAVVERSQAEGSWHRMKACAAGDCHWAYYDHSRNRSRTWCDMAVCGNRAKARAYRARSTE